MPHTRCYRTDCLPPPAGRPVSVNPIFPMRLTYSPARWYNQVGVSFFFRPACRFQAEGIVPIYTAQEIEALLRQLRPLYTDIRLRRRAPRRPSDVPQQGPEEPGRDGGPFPARPAHRAIRKHRKTADPDRGVPQRRERFACAAHPHPDRVHSGMAVHEPRTVSHHKPAAGYHPAGFGLARYRQDRHPGQHPERRVRRVQPPPDGMPAPDRRHPAATVGRQRCLFAAGKNMRRKKIPLFS